MRSVATRFFVTEHYQSRLTAIEDFIFGSTQDIGQVERFYDEHDRALEFIGANPETPGIHPATGDQSWPFDDGRYRLFFKAVRKQRTMTIYLTHLIDNRQANLTIYPGNSLPTYHEEE